MATKAATILGMGFAGSYLAHRLAQAGWYVTIVDPAAERRLAALETPHDEAAAAAMTPGIGQSPHLHVLLARGLALLTKAYPGLEAQLDAARAPTIDWAGTTVWRTPFGVAPVYDSGIATRSFGRVFLDRLMLDTLRRHPRVRIVSAAAGDLAVDRGLVRGVPLATPERWELEAAPFVVDCRGRGAPAWSDASTPRDEVAVGILYRSLVLSGVSLPRQHYEQPVPPTTFDGAVLTPIEDGRATLTVIHWPGSKHLKSPMASVLATLPDPAFAAAFQAAAAKGPERVFRFDACRKRTASRAPTPCNLVALGDARYQLNPVYGQGMTLAALSVENLVARLEQGSLAGFDRAMGRLVAVPWALSSAAPGTTAHRLLHWTVRRAFRSPRAHRAFLEVQHLRASAAHLAWAALAPAHGGDTP